MIFTIASSTIMVIFIVLFYDTVLLLSSTYKTVVLPKNRHYKDVNCVFCTIRNINFSNFVHFWGGIFDKIKVGLKNAKNYLETARDIADLVSKSLRPKEAIKKRGDNADFSEKQNKPLEAINVVSTFLKLLGLDSIKITAVAVNSFIFVAQVISELFKLSPKIIQAKSISEEINLLGPMKLITENENEKIQNLLKLAYDKSLPSQLIERTNGLDSSCIRLLICKISPVILAAQKSLKNGSINRRDITSWLPTKEKFEDYSDNCEEKYSDCSLKLDL